MIANSAESKALTGGHRERGGGRKGEAQRRSHNPSAGNTNAEIPDLLHLLCAAIGRNEPLLGKRPLD